MKRTDPSKAWTRRKARREDTRGLGKKNSRRLSVSLAKINHKRTEENRVMDWMLGTSSTGPLNWKGESGSGSPHPEKRLIDKMPRRGQAVGGKGKDKVILRGASGRSAQSFVKQKQQKGTGGGTEGKHHTIPWPGPSLRKKRSDTRNSW